MSDVKHMKWWGWGVEGVSFHYDDKPAFAPFVKKAVDLDLDANKPTSGAIDFDSLPIPESTIDDALLSALQSIVGVSNVRSDSMERIVHTYGKSIRDLLRLRAGDLPRVPDVVVYPGDEKEVQEIVDRVVAADAVLIPFGGGSNISGSLEPRKNESRVVVSVDLGSRTPKE